MGHSLFANRKNFALLYAHLSSHMMLLRYLKYRHESVIAHDFDQIFLKSAVSILRETCTEQRQLVAELSTPSVIKLVSMQQLCTTGTCPANVLSPTPQLLVQQRRPDLPDLVQCI